MSLLYKIWKTFLLFMCTAGLMLIIYLALIGAVVVADSYLKNGEFIPNILEEYYNDHESCKIYKPF